MFTFFLLLRNNADAMRNWLVCVLVVLFFPYYYFTSSFSSSFSFLNVFKFTRICRHTSTDTIKWFTFRIFFCWKSTCALMVDIYKLYNTIFHLWISLYSTHHTHRIYQCYFWRKNELYFYIYFVYICVVCTYGNLIKK